MVVSVRRRLNVDVPEGTFAGDTPLVAVMRGSYVGSLHRGSAAVVDSSGIEVLALGDPSERVFLRSGAKPFQVIPAVLSGGIDRFGITQQELAVLCASHSGEPRHAEAVLSVLEKIGLGENDLRCGVHPPLHENTARDRWAEGIEPTPVCNNCSGAHTGMLVACRTNGWPIDNYGDVGHPVQRLTLEKLAALADINTSVIEVAMDNCAVPTFRLPLRTAAIAFGRLAKPSDLSPGLAETVQRIVGAMTSYPEMVGGEERFDTDLMRAAGGKVVAKGGAEGFQGVGLVASGLGLALKISDGGARAVPPAILKVLDYLQALEPSQLEGLRAYREPEVRNLQDQPVGKLTPVFNFGDNS
jgi:L-asparaginase II